MGENQIVQDRPAESSPSEARESFAERMRATVDKGRAFLLGYDLFISYRRADANSYALRLTNRLTKLGFRCYLDQFSSPADSNLPEKVKYALCHSTGMVIVGSPGALESKAIAEEVLLFSKLSRTFLPLNIADSLNDNTWGGLIKGISRTEETSEALAKGRPSRQALARLSDSVNFRRRNEQLKRIFFGLLAVIAFVIIAGVGATSYYNGQALNARTQAQEAEQSRKAAVEASQVAEKQRAEIESSLKRVREELGLAQADVTRATTDKEKAEKGARLAQEREEVARAQAEEQKRIATEQEKRNRSLTYIGNMQLAQQSLESGKMERAQKFLEAFLPTSEKSDDLRGYEWYHLWNWSHRKLASVNLEGDKGTRVRAVAVSPKAKYLATASNKGLRLWDGTDEASVRLVKELAKGNYKTVSYSHDGNIIAASSGNVTNLWAANTLVALKPIVQMDGKKIESIAFSPAHNSRLATLDEGGVNIWDITLDNYSQTFKTIPLPGVYKHDDFPAFMLAFSPDGKRLSIVVDEKVAIWELPSGDGTAVKISELHVQSYPDSTLLMPDNQTVAIMFGTDLQLWDINTRAIKSEFKIDIGIVSYTDQQPPPVTAVLSPDGKLLATGSTGPVVYGGGVKLWETFTGKLLDTLDGLGARGRVETLAFSQDGKTLAIGSRAEVQLSDAAPSRVSTELFSTKDSVTYGALSPDGKLLATISAARDQSGVLKDESKTLNFWDPRTGRLIHTHPKSRVTFIAFSPDGEKYVTSTWARALSGRRVHEQWAMELWNAHTHASLGPPLGETSQPEVVFSPDGKTLAVAVDDYRNYDCKPQGCLQFIDLATGKKTQLAPAPKNYKWGNFDGDAPETFSPNGRILIVRRYMGGGLMVSMLDTKTNKIVANFGDANQSVFNSFSFSRDGRTLAIAQGDSTVSLWDVSSLYDVKEQSSDVRQRDEAWTIGGKNFIGMIEGHTGEVMSIAFSPDGRTIATASEDGTVKLWDTRFYQLLTTLRGYTGMVGLVFFTPDGSRLITSGKDQSGGFTSIKLWHATTKEEIALQMR